MSTELKSLKDLFVTEDPLVMIEIGKQLLQLKSNIYNERMMSIINCTIDEQMPDASDEEKEDTKYRAIYDYWVYGNNIAEEFYFDFKNKTDAQKREYITFRQRFLYMNYLNSQETRHFLDNKWDAYQLMKPYYRRDAILISCEADYDSFCEFVNRHPTFVSKPVGLGAAAGVHKVIIDETLTKKEAFKAILEESKLLSSTYPWGNAKAMMLEEVIKQAPEMACLHPKSVQSIRLVTIKVGNRVHIWYPRIDIGRNNSFLINGAAGGIMAVIDPKTGVIIENGRPESGESFEYHPDTGIRIKGFQIPRWNELIDMAADLMTNVVPETRYVGWDMALTENGWCVVEGNWAGEFVGDQLGYGRGLKHELEELIGWKPDKQYWWEK